MSEHAEARELISARADGEPEPGRAAELDSHLAACKSCAAFAAGVDGLRAAAQHLSVEHAPDGLAFRIQRTLPRFGRTRLLAAVAAVVALALLVVTTNPTGGFTLPGAEAARALTEIQTLFVDRTIERQAPDGGTVLTVRERIWFRAPELVRIERRWTGEGVRFSETSIDRRGEHYEQVAGGQAEHTINVAPDAQTIVEPLTTTLAVLGTPIGAGPTVAGRRTIRYEVTAGGEQRTALIDADHFTLLGTEPSVVLQKERQTESVRTRAIRYNTPIPEGRFVIPSVDEPIDGGFRTTPVSALSVIPAAVPDGFDLVSSGRTGQAEYLTYARGAFLILVSTSDEPSFRPDQESRPVKVGERTGYVNTPLYGVPRIVFDHQGRQVRVQAPLMPSDLAELAEQMFPE